MKRTMRLRNLVLAGVWAAGLLGRPPSAAAGVPAIFNYQGKLTDAGGTPITGSVPMLFRVYDGLGALKSTYTPAAPVTVTNGVFSVAVGDTGAGSLAGAGLDAALSGSGDRFLEVVVNGRPLTPRQRLLAVPYAMSVADASITDASVAVGAGIAYAKLSLAGSIVDGDLSPGAYLNVTGLGAQSRDLNMNGHRITGLPAPAGAGEAATKGYVDAASVPFGSTAGTAVQGNTQVTVAAGAGLSGGGTLTLGSGGTVTLTNTGDINPLDDLTTSTSFGGDLSGLFSSLQLGAGVVGPAEMAGGAYPGVTGLGAQSQDLNMNAHKITGLAAPASAGEAATKGYVDAASVRFGSTAGTAVQGNTQVTVAAGAGLSGGGTLTLGSGGTVTLTNTGDINPLDDLTTSTAFGGDLSGFFSNLQLGAGVVGASELASSGVSAGTYGNATNVAQISVDADGRVTSASNVPISGGGGVNGSGVAQQVAFWIGTGVIGGNANLTYNPAGTGGLNLGGELQFGNALTAIKKSGAFMDITTNVGVLRLSSAGGEIQLGTSVSMDSLRGTGTVPLNVSASGALIRGTSDARLKDIRGDFTRGLDALMRIQPKVFFWNEKSGMKDGRLNAGFIAQNVRESIPEAIGSNKDGYLSLNDVPIVAALVNAVKEQQAQIDALRKELEALRRP